MREAPVARSGAAAAGCGLDTVEWPTAALAGVIYGGWTALTWWHAALPPWLVWPALIWLVAWHGSLQHEVLHGHPTRRRRLNDALGFPPLALWLPYALYRRAHLRHHVDARLTDPLDDPESYYWTPALWQALSRPGRMLVRAQGTLLGRLLLGPGWSIGRFAYFQAGLLRRGERGVRRIWAWHLAGVAVVLAWLWGVCGIAPLIYVMAVVYPAMALTLLRSFAEHRAAPGVPERIAVVEGGGPFGLLFLHNNLHAVHHAWPRLPWYRIPAIYRQHRAALVAANGGLLYRGYGEVAWRYLLAPHDAVLHPLGRAPGRTRVIAYSPGRSPAAS